MATDDFFRSSLDAIIDLKHSLAMRLPLAAIEASEAPKVARQVLPVMRLRGEDLRGAYDAECGGGINPASGPHLPIRPMASQLHLKNSFNLSDEELVERWAENVAWEFHRKGLPGSSACPATPRRSVAFGAFGARTELDCP